MKSRVLLDNRDCPFVDHETLDYCIEESMMKGPFDLSTTKGYFPTGIDYEIVRLSTLQKIEKREISAEDKEHLTLHIYNNSAEFKQAKTKRGMEIRKMLYSRYN